MRSHVGGTSKPFLSLDGRKVIVENTICYDGSIPTSYRKEVIYHFKSEEQAREYYYKMK